MRLRQFPLSDTKPLYEFGQFLINELPCQNY